MPLSENSKVVLGHILVSFIGCMLALLVIFSIGIIVLFAVITAAPDYAISTLEGLSIECSEDYSREGFAFRQNGVYQYCHITERPKQKDFEITLEVVQ